MVTPQTIPAGDRSTHCSILPYASIKSSRRELQISTTDLIRENRRAADICDLRHLRLVGVISAVRNTAVVALSRGYSYGEMGYLALDTTAKGPLTSIRYVFTTS
jgi:hypothetical protein